MTGPGTIYETNGNVRYLGDNQSLAVRSQGNKYMELVTTLLNYLGWSNFLQKYTDFVSNFQLPKLL